MKFLTELLSKQRYPVFLLLIVFVFFGNYSLSGELFKPHIKQIPSSAVLIFAGVIAIVISVILFVLDEDFVAYQRGCRIRNLDYGFETTFRDSTIGVRFGALQEIYDPSDQTTVAILPANEFFDKRCFSDAGTTAGAFVTRYFPQDADALEKLVHSELMKNYPANITMVAGKKSYGVGTCVYLSRPLGSQVHLILASVASDRDPHGLRTELSTIFKVVEEIKCLIATEHLSGMYIPLLGAGKGGVPSEIAFVTLVSALLEARCKDGGHHLKTACLVVFKPPDLEPQLLLRKAKRNLRQLVNLYQEMSR